MLFESPPRMQSQKQKMCLRKLRQEAGDGESRTRNSRRHPQARKAQVSKPRNAQQVRAKSRRDDTKDRNVENFVAIERENINESKE